MTDPAQYGVIRFSPDPEVVEPINVGVLVVNGRWHLRLDEHFTRLGALVPDAPKTYLRRYLELFANSLDSPDIQMAKLRLESSSAQFTLENVRQIAGRWDASLLDTLHARYLTLPREKKYRSRRERGTHVSTKLENLLLSDLRLPRDMVLKRPSAEAFLGARVRRHLGGVKIRFSRVLRTPSRLVVLDGLDVSQTPANVERRAVKLSKQYFHLSRIEDYIRRYDHRELTQVAFVFGSPSADKEAKVAYPLELLKREAREVVHERESADVARWRQHIRELAGPQLDLG